MLSECFTQEGHKPRRWSPLGEVSDAGPGSYSRPAAPARLHTQASCSSERWLLARGCPVRSLRKPWIEAKLIGAGRSAM